MNPWIPSTTLDALKKEVRRRRRRGGSAAKIKEKSFTLFTGSETDQLRRNDNTRDKAEANLEGEVCFDTVNRLIIKIYVYKYIDTIE